MVNQFYDVEHNWNKDFNYLLLLGGKNIGKSFSVKKTAFTEAWENKNKKVILMRRSVEEIKPSYLNTYFKDLDIKSISKGAANLVEIYQKQIWAYKYDPDSGKKTRIKSLGYTCALSVEHNLSSGVYLDVDKIIFEEFASRSGYLPDEVTKLAFFVSTVARMRKIKVVLIGNTISRVCPYYTKWKLTGVAKQKIGTTDEYIRPSPCDPSVEIKILVEYIKSGVSSQMFFGDEVDTITNGNWQTKKTPRLIGNITKVHYLMVFEAMGFKFLAQLVDTENLKHVWFISPKTTRIKNKTRVISTELKGNDKLYTRGLYPLNKLEQIIFNLFDDNHVFYSDDLCAADFKNVYKEIARGRGILQ